MQRVKLTNDCYSDWGPVPSGAPQGTKLGPWLFVLMNNDLCLGDQFLWKFVDDTTASEIVPRGCDSNTQVIVDKFISWSYENRVQLNSGKCKELRISFSKQPPVFEPIIVDGQKLEVVKSAKLLGIITINSDLSWNNHIDEVIKKVNKIIYYLIQLKHANISPKDLSLFYVTCIRSVMDYKWSSDLL